MCVSHVSYGIYRTVAEETWIMMGYQTAVTRVLIGLTHVKM